MGNKDTPWRDKYTLYKLYHGQGLDKRAIGDRLGCSDVTVGNWMQRRGVPDTRAWQRPGFVETLYLDHKLSQSDIAERLDCDQTSVGRTLDDAGVETRDAGDYTHPSIYYSQSGYLTCRHRLETRGERVAFRVHRLVAVAEYGFDAVAGNDVHHKNGHRADDRHENLEPIPESDHAELHHEQGDILESYPS